MAKKKAEKDKKATTKKATKVAKKKKAPAENGEAIAGKKAVKKKGPSRKKAASAVRIKLFWGVFNHALKRVALYDFNQRKAADKRAKELTESGKPPHFVMKVKEPVDEKKA
jgi:hypothetical protein